MDWRAKHKRHGVSAAAVLAAAIIVTAGVSVVFLYPSLSGTKGFSNTESSETTRAPSTTLVSTTSLFNSTFTTYFTSSESTTSETMSSEPGGWQEWAVLNATLGYNKTQEYIHDAWNYTYNVVQTATNGPMVFISDYVEVIGLLRVTGNWTTGYMLNYTRLGSLNVTAQYTPGNTYYPIVFFSAHNSSGITEPIQFNPTQQKAISIAVTSETAETFIQQYPTFVDDAWVFPSTNSTFGGDYLVWIFQTNGPRILGVFVSVSSGQVVSTYDDTRAVTNCFSNGACFTSPWGA